MGQVLGFPNPPYILPSCTPWSASVLIPPKTLPRCLQCLIGLPDMSTAGQHLLKEHNFLQGKGKDSVLRSGVWLRWDTCPACVRHLHWHWTERGGGECFYILWFLKPTFPFSDKSLPIQSFSRFSLQDLCPLGSPSSVSLLTTEISPHSHLHNLRPSDLTNTCLVFLCFFVPSATFKNRLRTDLKWPCHVTLVSGSW